MKMLTILAISFFLFFNSAQAGRFKLEKSLMDTRETRFVPHTGDGEWNNYLAMNLPFAPVADVFKQLLIKERIQLTSRAEAHLTIITPIEYWRTLKPAGVTIAEINELAAKAKIQSLGFTPICLGQGSALLEGTIEKTFYIVVKSSDAINMRKAIKKLFVSRGGDASLFLPESFYPHITIGFTKRDLHESDKVIKNKSTCIYELDLI